MVAIVRESCEGGIALEELLRRSSRPIVHAALFPTQGSRKLLPSKPFNDLCDKGILVVGIREACADALQAYAKVAEKGVRTETDLPEAVFDAVAGGATQVQEVMKICHAEKKTCNSALYDLKNRGILKLLDSSGNEVAQYASGCKWVASLNQKAFPGSAFENDVIKADVGRWQTYTAYQRKEAFRQLIGTDEVRTILASKQPGREKAEKLLALRKKQIEERSLPCIRGCGSILSTSTYLFCEACDGTGVHSKVCGAKKDVPALSTRHEGPVVEERRVHPKDKDGISYTRSEFLRFYGTDGQRKWDESTVHEATVCARDGCKRVLDEGSANNGELFCCKECRKGGAGSAKATQRHSRRCDVYNCAIEGSSHSAWRPKESLETWDEEGGEGNEEEEEPGLKEAALKGSWEEEYFSAEDEEAEEREGADWREDDELREQGWAPSSSWNVASAKEKIASVWFERFGIEVLEVLETKSQVKALRKTTGGVDKVRRILKTSVGQLKAENWEEVETYELFMDEMLFTSVIELEGHATVESSSRHFRLEQENLLTKADAKAKSTSGKVVPTGTERSVGTHVVGLDFGGWGQGQVIEIGGTPLELLVLLARMVPSKSAAVLILLPGLAATTEEGNKVLAKAISREVERLQKGGVTLSLHIGGVWGRGAAIDRGGLDALEELAPPGSEGRDVLLAGGFCDALAEKPWVTADESFLSSVPLTRDGFHFCPGYVWNDSLSEYEFCDLKESKIGTLRR